MSNHVCEIKWVDPISGRSTPDENSAIGMARIEFFDKNGEVTSSSEFPICREHLIRMPDKPSYWDGKIFSRWSFRRF